MLGVSFYTMGNACAYQFETIQEEAMSSESQLSIKELRTKLDQLKEYL